MDSNGKLQHLFVPSKTATLVPAFAVKDLPLGRILDDDDDDDDDDIQVLGCDVVGTTRAF